MNYTSGKVFYNRQLAGIIAVTANGYTFTYDTVYLQNPQALPVSLTLPLTAGAYFSPQLFPFFDGLIPEGWLLDMALKRWGLKPYDRFALLLHTCQDAIGAVSIIPNHSITC